MKDRELTNLRNRKIHLPMFRVTLELLFRESYGWPDLIRRETWSQDIRPEWIEYGGTEHEESHSNPPTWPEDIEDHQ